MNEQFEKNIERKMGRVTFHTTPKTPEELTVAQGRELTEESFLALEDVSAIEDFDVSSRFRPTR